VDSAVARLTPLRERAPRIDDPALYARVVAAAFSQRRKTLRNALATVCDADAMRRAGIDPGLRGEVLSVADFVRLAEALAGR
jgi:16S rRNA (adenine1518-N6/adenine1519-N6)-dimethyltransferase